jgi:hypothetical protein
MGGDGDDGCRSPRFRVPGPGVSTAGRSLLTRRVTPRTGKRAQVAQGRVLRLHYVPLHAGDLCNHPSHIRVTIRAMIGAVIRVATCVMP